MVRKNQLKEYELFKKYWLATSRSDVALKADIYRILKKYALAGVPDAQFELALAYEEYGFYGLRPKTCVAWMLKAT